MYLGKALQGVRGVKVKTVSIVSTLATWIGSRLVCPLVIILLPEYKYWLRPPNETFTVSI